MEKIRLQKFLADAGVASRRKCEEYITKGLVSINGKVISELGVKVDPKKDVIKYNEQIVKTTAKYIYILLNKPLGYVTTASDQFNRPIVMDLLKDVKQRVVPVGRLDMYTTGALILTNDGEFVNNVIHPKNNINKTYIVVTKGIPTKEEIEKLKKGVEIDGYTTKEAKIEMLEKDTKKDTSKVKVIIHEGKNRQIRKMFDIIEKPIISIHRIKIGRIDVSDLKLGEYRKLKKEEIESLWTKKKSKA